MRAAVEGAWILAMLAACGGPTIEDLRSEHPGSGLRVVLVGIDGATWSVIDPLLEAGRLPVLADGLSRGVRATLRSEDPMTSPALWTTLATGRARGEHGIMGFLSERGLVRSTDRRVPALWNVLDAFERESEVLGWWATWPAEVVRGRVVTDRAVRTRWVEWAEGEVASGRTWPEELFARVRPAVVDPLAPPMDELDRLVDWTAEERAEFLALERPLYANGWSALKFGYASQRSYERVALEFARDGDPAALTALFLVAVDPVSHTFWHHREPRHYEGADWDAAERLGGTIDALYEHNDRFLGDWLRDVDEDTVVMIVSDHGFRASGRLPGAFVAEDLETRERHAVTVGQSGIHDLDGVLAAWGGPVDGSGFGASTREATLYDVAPTVLALLGLPVPRDMPGRVLEELVAPSFWEEHPIAFVESYDEVLGERRYADASEVLDPDRGQLEELEALGYFGHPQSPR